MAKEICGAKAKSTGKPCRRPAGWGTSHAGTGRCKFHGGLSSKANGDKRLKSGRYSLAHRATLQAKVDEFLQDPRPGDLTSELALMRALLQSFLDRYEDGVPMNLESIGAVYDMVESIGKLVERINRILTQTALTQAEVNLLQARLADLLVKYLDDPDERTAFLEELGQSLGRDRRDAREAVYGLPGGAAGEGEAS